SPAEDQVADGRDVGARGDQADLGAVDLAGARAAHLARGLGDELEAVDVGFGEIAAAGVDRQLAVRPFDAPARDELAALAPLAEAVVLYAHQDLAGEVLVDLGDVDVFRRDTRAREEVRSGFLEVRAEEVWLVEAGPTRAAALGRAHDVDRRLLEVA